MVPRARGPDFLLPPAPANDRVRNRCLSPWEPPMQDAQDEPLFVQRVAGPGIAKAGVEVTIRVPSDTSPGRRQQETRAFGTTRRELESLADWLGALGRDHGRDGSHWRLL